MKNIVKISLFAAVALLGAQWVRADLSDSYSAVAVGLSEEQGGNSPAGTSGNSHAWILVGKSDSEDAVKAAFAEIASADSTSMPRLITKSKDLKRAVKFAKGSKLNEIAASIASGNGGINIFKVGKFDVAVFDKSYAMRPGMNFMVFENSGGKLLWNASFSDPLMLLIAGGRPDVFPKVSTPMDGDDKAVKLLAEKKLPILNFKNGVLVSLAADGNVELGECAKFYHRAQEFFFECRLKEYSQFMTKESRGRFEAQFMSMPESEQKAVLKDYFSWKKRYLRAMESGDSGVVMIFFARERAGDSPQNDVTYFIRGNEGFKIANWGAAKTPLDMFLSKYILKDGGYVKNISERFVD